MDKRGVTQSGILLYDIIQWPIMPLGNVHDFIKKDPTFYSKNSFQSETSNIPQLKTQPNLHSKDKEWTISSLGVA